MSEDLEMKIQELETLYGFPGRAPGTVISRGVMDAKLCEGAGLKVEEGRSSVLVWGVGLGLLGEPKEFFYGLTISEAVERAHASATRRDK